MCQRGPYHQPVDGKVWHAKLKKKLKKFKKSSIDPDEKPSEILVFFFNKKKAKL